MDEVKILGAGVSGLTAAINLAKQGSGVTVFERSRDCGTRFAGDLQGLENWSSERDSLAELRQMGIEPSFEHEPYREPVTTDGENKDYTVRSREPFFYLLKRGPMEGSLDSALKNQAIGAEVRIDFGAKKSEQDVDIVASGPSPKRILPVIDKGYVFETDASNMAVSLVSNQAAYMGYSYLLVMNGYACLCSVVFDRTNLVDACLKKSVEIFERKFDVKVRNEKRVGGTAAFSLNSTFKKNNKLYVGEASGLQDMLWGFGIRTSINSGYFAAKSLAEGLDYEKLMKKRFGKYIRASVVNRYLWEKMSGIGYLPFFAGLKRSPDARKTLQKAYTLSFPRSLLSHLATNRMKKKYPGIYRSG